MTTIATDGKSMAGDGRTVDGWTIVSEDKCKIARLDDGSIVGAAGENYALAVFVDWMNHGGNDPKPDVGDSEFLLLRPDGTVWHGGRNLIFTQRNLPAAIGSGEEFALGALEAGAGIFYAIEIARKRDPKSGGSIFVEYLTGATVKEVANG